MTFKLFDVDFSAYLLLLTAISLLLTICTSFNNYVECFSSDVSLAKRLCRFYSEVSHKFYRCAGFHHLSVTSFLLKICLDLSFKTCRCT